MEISGSHSNIISDSYVFHYGNELVSHTGNKEIRHFVTTNFDQKYPFAMTHHFITLFQFGPGHQKTPGDTEAGLVPAVT